MAIVCYVAKHGLCASIYTNWRHQRSLHVNRREHTVTIRTIYLLAPYSRWMNYLIESMLSIPPQCLLTEIFLLPKRINPLTCFSCHPVVKQTLVRWSSSTSPCLMFRAHRLFNFKVPSVLKSNLKQRDLIKSPNSPTFKSPHLLFPRSSVQAED